LLLLLAVVVVLLLDNGAAVSTIGLDVGSSGYKKSFYKFHFY